MTRRQHEIEIEFAGLCSFVREKDAAGGKGLAHVLLVDSENAPVEPPLCPHEQRLVFDGADLLEVSGDPEYLSYLSLGDKVECLWDVSGCDLAIEADGAPTGAVGAEPEELFDLTPYSGGVDPAWVYEPLTVGGLVGARFRLAGGELEVGRITEESYSLCRTPDDCKQHEVRFAQTVKYRLGLGEGSDRTVRIAARHLDGSRHSILLRTPTKLTVSSLCAVTPETTGEERDVLAYYELCRERGSRPRYIPMTPARVLAFATPDKSACPPVAQELS